MRFHFGNPATAALVHGDKLSLLNIEFFRSIDDPLMKTVLAHSAFFRYLFAKLNHLTHNSPLCRDS